jgi:hypothetical protein
MNESEVVTNVDLFKLFYPFPYPRRLMTLCLAKSFLSRLGNVDLACRCADDEVQAISRRTISINRPDPS